MVHHRLVYMLQMSGLMSDQLVQACGHSVHRNYGQQVPGRTGKRGRSASRDGTEERGNSRGSSGAPLSPPRPRQHLRVSPRAARSANTQTLLAADSQMWQLQHALICPWMCVAHVATCSRASQCFLCCEPGSHKGGHAACPKVPSGHGDAAPKVVAARGTSEGPTSLLTLFKWTAPPPTRPGR
jgi:hypothetical protein